MAVGGTQSGPMMIQSISNVKIIEFTVPQLLDQLEIEQIQEQLGTLAQKTGHPKFVVSFEGVTAISSAMLGALISVNSQTKKLKGELRLAHINPQLMQVFKMTNLHKLLKIFKSTDDALKKF